MENNEPSWISFTLIKVNRITDTDQCKSFASVFTLYMNSISLIIKGLVMYSLKKIIFIILVLMFPFQTIKSQTTKPITTPANQTQYDYYVKKHKKLKTTGWILLGGGLAAAAGGYAIAANNMNVFSDENDDEFVAGSGLFVLGTMSMISSIPVLIVSGSNKRKAEAILSTGKIGYNSLHNQDYVSAGVRFSF